MAWRFHFPIRKYDFKMQYVLVLAWIDMWICIDAGNNLYLVLLYYKGLLSNICIYIYMCAYITYACVSNVVFKCEKTAVRDLDQ